MVWGKTKGLGVLLFFLVSSIVSATHKQVALSFDDSPGGMTEYFSSIKRTQELIKKLSDLDVPPAMVFTNPCLGANTAATLKQLKLFRDKGHLIGNHTCSHPRLDKVGFEAYSKDASKADEILKPLFSGQKFFRFPFLNEGTQPQTRDQMREWLVHHQYRNGMVSIDNDDYVFSFKINQAKKLGKKINYEKVKELFLSHLIGAADFYDKLALKTLGRSPKHVMLLHEKDATVMFISDLVEALKANGWTLIDIEDAYQDPVYLEQPLNTYTGNGIIAQIATDKTGQHTGYFVFDKLVSELDKLLGL
jgi:peptidoglycan/xylan/chitin deacetylase (PgdA/CDA1 family)